MVSLKALAYLFFSVITEQGLSQELLFPLCLIPDDLLDPQVTHAALITCCCFTPTASRTLRLFPAFPGLLSPRGEESGQNSTCPYYFLSFLTSFGFAEFKIIQKCCQMPIIILSKFLNKHILHHFSAYTKWISGRRKNENSSVLVFHTVYLNISLA